MTGDGSMGPPEVQMRHRSPNYLLAARKQYQTDQIRSRHPNALRKMFLKTGVTPSASGSAYLELETQPTDPSLATRSTSLLSTSGLKLTCTVHGPRPLPRSASFSPNIILSTHVKYAPFATRQRRGYVRDASERDLAVHIETALRGVVIGDRWPKSSVEVIIIILESEDDCWWGEERREVLDLDNAVTAQLGMMSVLSGCITVASAAVADAGIDCVDMVSGGVAALVRDRQDASNGSLAKIVLDPVPSEHQEVLATCLVGYLPSRDEITDLWVRGGLANSPRSDILKKELTYEDLTDKAVLAALGAHQVIKAAIKEAAELRINQ